MWNCIQNAAPNVTDIFPMCLIKREVYILLNPISTVVCRVFYFWLTDRRTRKHFLGWTENWLENNILWYNFLKYVFMSNRIAQTKYEKSHIKFWSWI